MLFANASFVKVLSPRSLSINVFFKQCLHQRHGSNFEMSPIKPSTRIAHKVPFLLSKITPSAKTENKKTETYRPIPRNSVESEHGCTSRIYFDNAGNNMTLTLYNVTLTSRKPCLHSNKCDCCKRNSLNEANKISL